MTRFAPDPIPQALRALLDDHDPAMAAITRHVVAAVIAGQDPRDEAVVARCITRGRYDHAAEALGGAA